MKLYLGKTVIENNQDIVVGSLVVRQKTTDQQVSCLMYTSHPESDNDPMLGICIGLVIDAIPGEEEVIVHWVQKCSYAEKVGAITQEGMYRNQLRIVGQLH